MNEEEREHMTRLCLLIQTEQDPSRFTALMLELNELLERNERRLADDGEKDRNSNLPDIETEPGGCT